MCPKFSPEGQYLIISKNEMGKYWAKNILKPSCQNSLFHISSLLGHSAFIWLNSKENVKLYSFDIGEHNYTKPAAQLLQSIFPGRLHIKYGDSRWTLPEFYKLHPDVSCDLVVIDGGHYQNVPGKDLINFRKMASILTWSFWMITRVLITLKAVLIWCGKKCLVLEL